MSDYQGACGLLTDPQITSNPMYVIHLSLLRHHLTDILNHLVRRAESSAGEIYQLHSQNFKSAISAMNSVNSSV